MFDTGSKVTRFVRERVLCRIDLWQSDVKKWLDGSVGAHRERYAGFWAFVIMQRGARLRPAGIVDLQRIQRTR